MSLINFNKVNKFQFYIVLLGILTTIYPIYAILNGQSVFFVKIGQTSDIKDAFYYIAIDCVALIYVLAPAIKK